MNEWYYSNVDPTDSTQEVRNGGARLPVWRPSCQAVGLMVVFYGGNIMVATVLLLLYCCVIPVGFQVK